ncbi:zinc finger protein 511 [Gadus chalcogrammus]|uniref:zinc finger protein 511 n=1 Tax=Gadus chalcogrammus TaxID=1042646 RepID=UPI0024C48370|nr:zinc finger protein 511 [Gadus chalcogrammus]
MSVSNMGGFGGKDTPFRFTPQRIHLGKDHELFEDGDIHRHMYLQNLSSSETDEQPKHSVSEFGCHISGCCQRFRSVEEYEHHYNSLHRHVCSACRRSFPSARLLDVHIEEWHDAMFDILSQSQDMYQCLVEGCGLKFRTSKQRKDHLIQIHKYPPDFRFDKTKREHRKEQKPQTRQQAGGAEVMEGVCEAVLPATDPEQHQEEEEEEDMETVELQAPSGPGEQGSPSGGTPQPDAETVSDGQRPRYSYRVPATVCFGKGSVRGFRGRGRRK